MIEVHDKSALISWIMENSLRNLGSSSISTQKCFVHTKVWQLAMPSFVFFDNFSDLSHAHWSQWLLGLQFFQFCCILNTMNHILFLKKNMRGATLKKFHLTQKCSENFGRFVTSYFAYFNNSRTEAMQARVTGCAMTSGFSCTRQWIRYILQG